MYTYTVKKTGVSSGGVGVTIGGVKITPPSV